MVIGVRNLEEAKKKYKEASWEIISTESGSARQEGKKNAKLELKLKWREEDGGGDLQQWTG